jgi:hypothetical protein
MKLNQKLETAKSVWFLKAAYSQASISLFFGLILTVVQSNLFKGPLALRKRKPRHGLPFLECKPLKRKINPFPVPFVSLYYIFSLQITINRYGRYFSKGNRFHDGPGAGNNITACTKRFPSATVTEWLPLTAIALRFLEPMTGPMPAPPTDRKPSLIILAKGIRFSPAGPMDNRYASGVLKFCLQSSINKFQWPYAAPFNQASVLSSRAL